MVAAGLLAFLGVLAVLRERETVVQIPIVLSDIPAGDLVDTSSVSMVTARAPSSGLTDAAVTAEELDAAVQQGLVAAHHIPAASVLSAVDLVESREVSVARTMSIPVANTDGVGRALVRGDVVDIVAVVDGLASFVAIGVDVADIASSGQPGTGSATVSVEVDAATSLRLAWALSRTEVRFVRATGAPPDDSAAIYPEREVPADDD
jgi:hypothetical protein